jgi:tRNA(Ile)-lysidine synthase
MLKITSLNQYDTLLIAYSGGVDSQVLLDAVINTYSDKNIVALHVNHGISKNADDWAEFCCNTAKSNGVECNVLNLNLNNDMEGLEEKARNLRYQWFEKKAKEYSNVALLTGHHLNDQIETVLFRFFRGAGLSGLSGIAEISKRNDLMIVRPLLNYTKNEIIDYAKEKQLQWVEDESNKEIDYDRNFIRNEIMPLIKSRFPAAEKSIGQSIKEIQKINKKIKQDTLVDLKDCMDENKNLLAKEVAEKANANDVIREWFKKHNGQYPNKNILKTIRDDLIKKKAHNAGKLMKKNYTISKNNHKVIYKKG